MNTYEYFTNNHMLKTDIESINEDLRNLNHSLLTRGRADYVWNEKNCFL